MKIDSYNIGMESERNYTRKMQRHETLNQSFLSYSGFKEENPGLTPEEEESPASLTDQSANPVDDAFLSLNSKVRAKEITSVDQARSEFNKLHHMMMREILALLTGIKPRRDNTCVNTEEGLTGYATAGISNMTMQVSHISIEEWVEETETTGFSAEGLVKTSDGRELNVNLNIYMTRSFSAHFKQEVTMADLALIDPLVINFDTDATSLSDMTFLFDLDADGNAEEISKLNQGSGFLALDKNEDGIINDGSELFGTKSGNGFKDLKRFDSDGNGWIDENDYIFDKLKIYTKDYDNKDVLYTLKDLDIGAIYLGYGATEFALNNLSDNSTNGVIRNTGFFLREDGSAGSIQHVDFAS
ncbi:MAG: hypothetical protein J6U37_00240 [Lachnospiraceae bacterium]|nr:hypothetical protein [Lachnospiraceae bacterium]